MIRMTKSQFREFYNKQLKDLRDECDEMVRNGECNQEFADFRYHMVMDEILWANEGNIEIVPDKEVHANDGTENA